MHSPVPGSEQAAVCCSDQVAQLRSQLMQQELCTLEAETQAARHVSTLQEQLDAYRAHVATLEQERLGTMETLTALATQDLLHDKERQELARLRSELQLQRQELVSARAFLTEQQSSMLGVLQANQTTFTPADIQVLQAHISDIQSHRLDDLERLVRGRSMHERFAAMSKYTQHRQQQQQQHTNPGASTSQTTSIASLCSSLTDEEALLLDALAAAAPPPDPALQHISVLRLQLDRLRQCISTSTQHQASPGKSPQASQQHATINPVNVCHILREQQQEMLSLAHHLASQLEGAEARFASQSQTLANTQLVITQLKASKVSLLQESQQLQEVRSQLSAAQAAVAEQQAAGTSIKLKARQHIEALNKQISALRDQLCEQQQVLESTTHQLANTQQQLQAAELRQAQHTAEHAQEQQVLAASLQAKDALVHGLRDELRACQASGKEGQQKLEAAAKKLLSTARALEQERAERRRQQEQHEAQLDDVYQDMRQQLQTVMEAYAVELQALHDQIVRLETARTTTTADLLAALPSSPAGPRGATDHQVAVLQAQLMHSQQQVVELRSQVSQLTRQLADEAGRVAALRPPPPPPPPAVTTSARDARALNGPETVASLIATANHVIGQLDEADAGNGTGSGVWGGHTHGGHVGSGIEQLQQVLSAMSALKAKYERLKTKYMRQQLRQHLLQQVVMSLHSSLVRVHNSSVHEQQQADIQDVLAEAHALLSRLGLSKVQSCNGASGSSTPQVTLDTLDMTVDDTPSQTCRSSYSQVEAVVMQPGGGAEARRSGGGCSVYHELSFGQHPAAMPHAPSLPQPRVPAQRVYTASTTASQAAPGAQQVVAPPAHLHIRTGLQPQPPAQPQAQQGAGGDWGAAGRSVGGRKPDSGGGGVVVGDGEESEEVEGQEEEEGPLVPAEVLNRAAQYAGDEGLARPSSAVPSSMRPGSSCVVVPSSAVQLAAQYDGREGERRPSSATPSMLRPTRQVVERPVPQQVLQYVQQYVGDEGSARPSSAAPSTLRRPAPAHPGGASHPPIPLQPSIPDDACWVACGTQRTGSSSSTCTTQPPASLASTTLDSTYSGLGAPQYSLDAPSEGVAVSGDWEAPRVGITPGLEYGSDSSESGDGEEEEGMVEEQEGMGQAEEWEG